MVDAQELLTFCVQSLIEHEGERPKVIRQFVARPVGASRWEVREFQSRPDEVGSSEWFEVVIDEGDDASRAITLELGEKFKGMRVTDERMWRL